MYLAKRHLCSVTAPGSKGGARISQDQCSWGQAETDGIGQHEKAFLVEGTTQEKTRRHESVQRVPASISVRGL